MEEEESDVKENGWRGFGTGKNIPQACLSSTFSLYLLQGSCRNSRSFSFCGTMERFATEHYRSAIAK